jgi:hypothetical protein
MITCPHCNLPIEGAAASSSPYADSTPGEHTVCVYCTGFVVFNDDLTVRKLEPEEFAALDVETRTELKAARATVVTIQRVFQRVYSGRKK